jgi:uncharacterized protein DUF3105/TIR domain-containing protein
VVGGVGDPARARPRPAERDRYPARVTGEVFISFDRGPALAYTDGLARALTASGLPARYDREIGGDARWAVATTAIRGSTAVVVVMTPEAEQSAWVTAEIDYARQLGKPIFPLLLAGQSFASLAGLPVESVTSGALPSEAFVAALRGAAGPSGAAPTDPAPTMWTPAAATKSRTGLIVGLVAGGLALLLVGVVAIGAMVWRLADKPAPSGVAAGGTWEEQAAAIDGIQNYLVSHPEWYEVDPVLGNHRNGRITYPISPPAGGLHNPYWQNCMGDVYPAAVPTEHVMHSLEHGAVWVAYRPGLPRDQVDRLAQRVRDTGYLLMSPYPGLDAAIALQAWGYQLKLDDAGDRRIDAFIAALRVNATQEPGAPCSGGVTDTGTDPVQFR